MTANAPQMKGKGKIPCEDVALSNTIYYNCYRSISDKRESSQDQEMEGKRKRQRRREKNSSIRDYFIDTSVSGAEQKEDEHELEKPSKKPQKPLDSC